MTTTNLATFENRIAQLERQLHAGFEQGKLTRSELTEKQRELEQLRARLERDGYDGGGLDAGEAKRTSAALQRFTEGLRTDLSDRQENVGQRMRSLEQRIHQGMRDGSLTRTEAQQLLRELGHLRRGPSNETSIHERLDALEKHVRSERTDGDMNGRLRLADFEKRIDAGVRDGSLTRGEAAELRGRLDHLRGEGVTHLSPKDVNGLNAQIFRLRHNVPVDLSRRFDTAIGRIDDAWANGRISDRQAMQLANEVSAAIERLVRGESPATFGAELNRILEKLGLQIAAHRDQGQVIYGLQQARRA